MFSLVIKGFPTATSLQNFLYQSDLIPSDHPILFKAGRTTYTIEISNETSTE